MSLETVSVESVAPPTPRVPVSGPVRICSVTGLALVPYPTKGTWRIFKNAYGPLKARPRTSETPSEWNRFDLPGRATLYSSTIRRGAYAEVLAPLRPRVSALAALAAKVFPDVDPGSNPILDEWNALGHMIPGSIPKVWHAERSMAQIAVTTPGWYVDIEDPASLQVLRVKLAGLLNAEAIDDMDVSVIRGHNRVVTCAVAEWICSLYLEDGSVPLGIRYKSRHGTDWECWATFPDTRVVSVGEDAIDLASDADLRAIANLFKLRLH